MRAPPPTVASNAKSDGVHGGGTDKGADEGAVVARIAAMEGTIRDRIGEHVWGTDADTLGGVVGAALLAHGWRLAVAESITGTRSSLPSSTFFAAVTLVGRSPNSFWYASWLEALVSILARASERSLFGE